MKKSKPFYSGLSKRVGSLTLAASLAAGSLYLDNSEALAASQSWKPDVEAAISDMTDALEAQDAYRDAQAGLEAAYGALESSESIENLAVTEVGKDFIDLEWSAFASDSLVGYNVYWADKNEEGTHFLLMDENSGNASSEGVITIPLEKLDKNAETVTFTVHKATNKNYFFKVAPVTGAGVGSKCDAVMSPTAISYDSYIEGLGRGLTAVKKAEGVYLNWRLLADEVSGYSDTGLTGVDFNIYRENRKIATVTDSTNYLDTGYTGELEADTYMLVPVDPETGGEVTDKACKAYDIFTDDSANQDTAYLDIPMQIPESTTFRAAYGIDEMALAGYTMTDSGYTSVDAQINYSANDMSVADVDGDGEYEYLVQWEPSWSKDVSQQGYTGKTYIDCYELNGTLLWRLDLGINIRAGAHYTEFGAYDYDKDGKAELIVKTAPGTKMIKYEVRDGGNVKDGDGKLKVASEDYITIPASDAAQGVTDTSNYVYSAEDYRAYLIEVFQDWGVWSRYSQKTAQDAIKGHWSGNLVELFSVSAEYSDSTFYTGEVEKSANVTFRAGDMTTEQIQEYIPEYQEGDTLVNVCLRDGDKIRYVSADAGVNPVMKTVLVDQVKDYYNHYDLASCDFDATDRGYTREQAEILADYFLKHYEYRMKKHSLETWEGYIITGPEYVTLFDCATGDELDTQDWFYAREDDGMLWGDYAMNYIEPGNRVDRYNVAVAYLDGETPSCIMGRGYYTRTTMVAYNVVGKKLNVAGNIDSGWTVMTNPFNDGPHGFDGCDPDNGALSGQGDHSIAVADVDGDGCQDIVNGGAIVSYRDGQMYLYSSGGDKLNGGTGDQWAKYGHGDAIHITDIDPDRPGLEIASCFEGAASAPYNWAVRDAKTNEVLFGEPGTSDYGRLIIGDVLRDVRGLEISSGYDCKGNRVSLAGVSTNQNIKWSADMSTQFITGLDKAQIIGNVDGKSYTYVDASGYATNNSTKGNPGLVADIFGDYREEMIVRASDSSHVRIYMNTENSDHKNYTLMQNLQYRVSVAAQNSSYNQPAYTDYYYASDTDWKYVLTPNRPSDQEPGKVEVKPVNVTLSSTSRTLLAGETLQLTAKVVPSSASQEVAWSVEDEQIATVSGSGLVTAVAGGTTYVTASTSNGKTSTCKISVVGAYEEEGLDKFPINETRTYSFGTSARTASGAKDMKVNSGSVYTEEAGYGWRKPEKITLTDGADYVAGTNYRSTDSSTAVVYEYPTFLLDVPVGVYEVKIVQGTDGSEKAVNGAYVEGNMYAVRWSRENFSVSFTEPSESSYIWTEAGAVRESVVETAVADGQLTINLATWLTDEGSSGTTYVKEISVTRKSQETSHSDQPTLRFIGDSTLAQYPPEDGGTWTPIPERTGWGEDFSMGRFVDDETVLVNKAVAGSSLKSYLYDGYYNDFFLNSRPGDTVIIESGINDSAAGRRYSDAAQFEEGLRYLIKSCQAFGLDVIISSGTSSSTVYTAKMEALVEEFGLPYVDLLNLWNAFLKQAGAATGDVTVDGTHLNRVGGIAAAQIVAGEIADLEGFYISGHVKKVPMNHQPPTASVTGLYVKAQTENSVTLAWNIEEDLLYQPDQLITSFQIYRRAKGASGEPELVTVQTAYVSAGMEGPQLQTSIEAPDSGVYTYYVTCKGLTGEGPASASVEIGEYKPSAAYTLLSLIERYNTQLLDASPYTVESYAALKMALAAAQTALADTTADEDRLKGALENVNAAVTGLQLNAVELEKEDFQKEPLKTAPWGAGGNHSGMLSCIMEEDGNRLLKLYVEASGERFVNKSFDGAGDVEAAVEELKFEWYPGQPDTRNCTEMEFFSGENRILSLKSSNNGHIGYVAGNYPKDNRYLVGDGFHDYEGSTAVDLGLTNEAWYNVKLVFRFADGKADLYIEPRDDASLSGKTVKDIAIGQNGNTITKLNFLLKRGRTDGDAGNDLSILWDTRLDDFGIYYSREKSSADITAYEKALDAYKSAVEGLNSSVLTGEAFVLAESVIDIMSQDVGFYTAADYSYAVKVLEDAVDAAPGKVETTSIALSAEKDSLTAGLTGEITAVLSPGANEQIRWSTSDGSIATVEGSGTKAVVTALTAGSVKITATGASSGKSADITLTVTGSAYFFGSEITPDSAYSAEKGYGFHNYTYPAAAEGWKDNIYYARTLVKQAGTSYVDASESGGDYLAVKGQVWTELPEGSAREEDTLTYENTGSFDADLPDGNYNVSVTFCNPTRTAMDVMVKAEDIRRYDYGDHASGQIAQASVGAGQTVTVDFGLALTDGQLTLRFEQNHASSSLDGAAARTVYVKSVSIDKYETEKRDKTAVFVMGDSTVQTYTNTDTYRTGWGQRLHTLFGALDQDTLYETGEGYAYYETEDTIVMNYARDARSAKSFLEEGRLNKVLLNLDQGDYVFLQFAHNDDNSARPNRFLSTDSYKEYLCAYNEAIAERGGTLVLVTPIVLNVWEADGSLDHRFDDYRRAMMEIAGENDIPVLDLMGSSLELVTQMGKANVDALAMYMSDAVHTKMAGANLYAGLLDNLLHASEDRKLDSLKELMNTESAQGGISVTCKDRLTVGEKADITVNPADQEAKISFYTSDDNVVSITDGTVKAEGPGTAIITAGYTAGNTATPECTAFTAYKLITVEDPALEEAGLTAETVTGTVPSLAAKAERGSHVNVLTGIAAAETAEQMQESLEPGAEDARQTQESLEPGAEDAVVTIFTDTEVKGKQPSPLADYQFDFGTKKGSAGEPFKTITATAYDSAAGYGFVSGLEGLNTGSHDDSSVLAGGDSEYDKSLMAAVSDACRNDNWEFAIDIPAGEYMVNVYVYNTWNNAGSNATYYINDQLIGTFVYDQVAKTAEEAAMSARVVADKDSQIIVRGAKGRSLAYISAITISEYVEREDDFIAEEWKELEAAMEVLRVKTSMFADDSTPFDYDVSLVNKMMAVMEAADNVRYMSLADTTTGDAFYANGLLAIADKLLYTESSIERLEEQMAAYQEAKNKLNVKSQVKNLYDTLEYWLKGVKTEGIGISYSLYADFDSTKTKTNTYDDNLGYLTPGWTSVGTAESHPYLTSYTGDTGYGLTAAPENRNRGTGNTLLDDFILGGTFAMDLPAGDYRVTMYTGDLGKDCKGSSTYQFYKDYDANSGTGTLLVQSEGAVTSPESGYKTSEYTFKLEEPAAVTMVASGHTQAMLVEQVIPAIVQSYDITELKELVETIDRAGLKEEDYTISSWAAFSAAYEEAQKAIEAGGSFAQQLETIYSNLEQTYAALVLRKATSEYALDFGPAHEGGEEAKVWADAPLLSAFHDMEKSAVELGLGTMLYENHTDDNGMHYGFTSETAAGYTATGGNYFRDYVYGAGGDAYTFRADLPVGYYYVYVYTGSKEAANTTKFYFNNGEPAAESTNETVQKDGEGRTVYTQTSNAGGQFVTPGCIYKVRVMESADTLSRIKGQKLGTLSLTLFHDDPNLAEDEVTARLNGIEICFAEELSEEDLSGGDASGGDASDGDASDGDASGGDANDVDKDALQSLVNRAKLLDPDRYTEESFAELTQALAHAREVLEDEHASQEAVDDALNALNTAIDKLVEKHQTDKAELESAIESAEEIDGGKYTEESLALLLKALKAARRILSSPDATQEQVEEALAALREAMANLTEKPLTDRTALADMITRAKALDGSRYTIESYRAVKTALQYAQKVFEDVNASQETINAAAAQLSKALDALAAVIQTDKASLEGAVGEAGAADSGKYTAESYDALAAALEYAKRVLEDPDATQEEIDQAVIALKAAMAALQEKKEDDDQSGASPDPDENRPGTSPGQEDGSDDTGDKSSNDNGKKSPATYDNSPFLPRFAVEEAERAAPDASFHAGDGKDGPAAGVWIPAIAALTGFGIWLGCRRKKK